MSPPISRTLAGPGGLYVPGDSTPTLGLYQPRAQLRRCPAPPTRTEERGELVPPHPYMQVCPATRSNHGIAGEQVACGSS